MSLLSAPRLPARQLHATTPHRWTNPFLALADDMDSATEEKSKPKTTQGMLYVVLTPWLGFGIFLLSFPVLWWNERRATGRRGKRDPPAGSATVTGTVVSENEEKGEVTVKGTVHQEEGQSLLRNPEEAYQQVVEGFEDRQCSYACCRLVRLCFDSMPSLEGVGDVRTYFFRVFGVLMMFTGIDMMLGPTYFLLRGMWFFGFLIAAHLAFCACKTSCLGSCCTILTSYVLHRPGVMAALVLTFVGISGLGIYYNVPVHAR
ncbi:unnamed protein product [Durusdinium trenchii]|uniref:Uncharacterized protein n=1 Tax=Durusdinium trenchii TaxID=1381693 RepID=A0ABP0KJ54_9DINO